MPGIEAFLALLAVLFGLSGLFTSETDEEPDDGGEDPIS